MNGTLGENRLEDAVSTVGTVRRDEVENRLEESLEGLVITGGNRFAMDFRLTCAYVSYVNRPGSYLSEPFCAIFELPSLL